MVGNAFLNKLKGYYFVILCEFNADVKEIYSITLDGYKISAVTAYTSIYNSAPNKLTK